MEATPTLVHDLIAAFKQRHDDLFQKAVAQEGDGLVSVFFEAGAFVVEAQFHKETAEFVRLVASPLHEPVSGEPAVSYQITPPEGEVWR